MTGRDEAAAVRDAERRIQAILIRLVDDTEKEIFDLSVDTRNFANLGVSVMLKDDDMVAP